MGKRGQFATEYVIIVGFMIAALLGGIYFFTQQAYGANTIHSEVLYLGNTLIDTASDLYLLGQPSKTTLSLSFPRGLKSIYVNPNVPDELIVLYDAGDGETEKIFLSRVNIAVNLNYLGRGKRDVILQAKRDAVSICVKEDLCNCDGFCQRPGENYTICAADCCTKDCHACNSSTGSNTSWTCANDSIRHPECDWHNNCLCSVTPCP